MTSPLAIIATTSVVTVALDTLTVRIASRLGTLVSVIDAIGGIAHTHRFASTGLAHPATMVAKLAIADRVLNAASVEVTSATGALVSIVGTRSSHAKLTLLYAASGPVALSRTAGAESTSTHVALDTAPIVGAAPKGALVVIRVGTIAGRAGVLELALPGLTDTSSMLAPSTVGQRHRQASTARPTSIDHATSRIRRTGGRIAHRTLGHANTRFTCSLAVITGTPVVFVQVDTLTVRIATRVGALVVIIGALLGLTVRF